MSQFDLFIKKIDEVFHLMLLGKFRNADDTLLHKLIGVINDGYRLRPFDKKDTNKKLRSESCLEKIDYFKDFLKKTSVWTFFKRALGSLQGSGMKLHMPIEVFSLHLLGAFAAHEDVFLIVKEDQSLLKLLCDIIRKNSVFPSSSSVLAALLTTLTKIALHPEGVSWLVQEKMVDFAFSSFAASSCYVRKEAINFLTGVLTTWSFSEGFCSEDPVQLTVKHAMDSIVKHLISGLTVFSSSEIKPSSFDCCISVLRQSMEKSPYINVFVCEKFHLLAEIMNALKLSKNLRNPPKNLLELIAESLCYSNSSDGTVTEVIHILLQHKFVACIIILLSSLLSRQSTIEKPLNKNNLTLIVWPLIMISNSTVTPAPPEQFVQILSHQMSDKNTCIALVQISVNAVSKLLPLMDVETLSCFINTTLDILHNNITEQVLSSMQTYVSTSRKVQLYLHNLLCSFLEEPVCQKLTKAIKLQLLDALISISENPTTDNKFRLKTLRMISKLIAIESQLSEYLPKEVKKRLMSMIQRKLQDTQCAVIDSSLEVIGQMILGCKDDELWQEWICILNIHTTVWDIATASKAENYVRASALRVLISFCLCPYIWEQLKSHRGADEDTIISFLCKFCNFPDVFVQRGSILSLFQWMQSSSINVPSTSSAAIFKTLTIAVRYSMDWDTKLIALRAWQWVAEKELSCFSLPTQQSNVQETLHSLCSIGYGSSILSALSDDDMTVQHEAIQALLTLRQTLLDLGMNEMSISLSDTNAANETSSTFNTPLWDYNIKLISEAEKVAGINDVLNINTVEQLCKIMPSIDNSFSSSECPPLCDNSITSSPFEAKLIISCPMKVFWEKLWSIGIESVISHQASDIYINDPVTLLDDILATTGQEDFLHNDEYNSADCY